MGVGGGREVGMVELFNKIQGHPAGLRHPASAASKVNQVNMVHPHALTAPAGRVGICPRNGA